MDSRVRSTGTHTHPDKAYRSKPYNEVYQFLTALLYQFTTARDTIDAQLEIEG